MTENTAIVTEPLWLSMEKAISELSSSDFEAQQKEKTIQNLAKSIDAAGHNVSRHAANMLHLRAAFDARAAAGSPLLTDFDDAVAALTLEDLENTHTATVALVRDVGETWPAIKDLDRRSGIVAIVEQKRIDLLIAEAKSLADDPGIRYLITKEVATSTITEALGITETKYDEVVAAIAAEKAETARVEGLLAEVADQSAENKARHLITNDVTDESLVTIAGLDQGAIDAARLAMAEEIKEKERLAAEAEAAKKAAAEGPSLDSIPADEMLEYIESIREIMEFSDDPDEIRSMCDQSSIPKSLVDVAVSDADKLDELEKAAEG
jgi:hypothetical protein